VNHVSLDGVIQSPGRADEDTRGGFVHGGWAAQPEDDPELGSAISERLGSGFSWLFGRRSYDDMLGHWNDVGGPFADGLNAATKYVVSSRGDTELRWPNSVLVSGDVPARIGALRAEAGGNLVIMGSSQLIHSLMSHELVDELFLMIHPLVLGSGLRLFGPDPSAHTFELVQSHASASGILMVSYQRSDA